PRRARPVCSPSFESLPAQGVPILPRPSKLLPSCCCFNPSTLSGPNCGGREAPPVHTTPDLHKICGDGACHPPRLPRPHKSSSKGSCHLPRPRFLMSASLKLKMRTDTPTSIASPCILAAASSPINSRNSSS